MQCGVVVHSIVKISIAKQSYIQTKFRVAQLSGVKLCLVKTSLAKFYPNIAQPTEAESCIVKLI